MKRVMRKADEDSVVKGLKIAVIESKHIKQAVPICGWNSIMITSP